MTTADDLISLLGLRPHPTEGGYFAETYRCDESLADRCLPEGYHGARPVSTAIYYLVTPQSFSAMHQLRSDEVFHFNLGDPVDMLQLRPDGSGRVVTLGSDIRGGMRPQVVVPRGVWQGTRLHANGSFALLGTTVAPGFDFADYEDGDRDRLVAAYPDFADAITALTR